MQQRNVTIIRVDGNSTIGGGHVFRCITLAKRLNQHGTKVIFITSDGYAEDLITSSGFTVLNNGGVTAASEKDASHTAEVIECERASWLIVDGYHFDNLWTQHVLENCAPVRILRIDDLDQKAITCDYLLNPTYVGGGKLQFQVPVIMAGSEFRVLRNEFYALRDVSVRNKLLFNGRIKSVVIQPGAFDEINLVPNVLRAVKSLNFDSIKVIMSSRSQSLTETQHLIKHNPIIKLELDATNVAELLADADMCIGAGGMSSLERCCLGVPSINFSVADNQLNVNDSLRQKNAIILGDIKRIDEMGYVPQLVQELCDRYRELVACSQKLVCGDGVQNVVNALCGQLIPVTIHDCEQVYSWRNHISTRLGSMNSASISFAAHEKWFNKAICNTSIRQYFYIEGNERLGYVRLQQVSSEVVSWSFYKNPNAQNKLIGSKMLSNVLHMLLKEGRVLWVKSIVKVDNQKSLDLHRRLGFELEIAKDDYVSLKRSMQRESYETSRDI